MKSQLPAVAIAAIDALLVVVASYALLRGYDALFRAEVNPALVMWSAKIAMFWRLGVGIYLAGPVALMAWLGARRNLARATRVTAALVPAVGALIAIQGALLP